MVKKIQIVTLLSFLIGCHHAPTNAFIRERGTPVQVTTIAKETLTDTLALYGNTIFLKKTTIISPIAGYIRSINAGIGDVVENNTALFSIQTKEAAAYANPSSDTFLAAGIITVRNGSRCEITNILKQNGDYVQEGETLCETVDPASLVVVLSFPFKENNLIASAKNCMVIFPDGRVLTGVIKKLLPEVDIASQTQQAYVGISSNQQIPENLNVQVKFQKPLTPPCAVLPKSAILTDETMNEYWVMKLINDSTAVKQNVTIGRKTKDEVEITEPDFTPDDRILISGNYGLPDTAKVVIVK